MEREQLERILKEHSKWLSDETTGKRASLRGANLREANLREANLVGASLRGASLREAILTGANLREANLREANLVGAILRGAILARANLRGANLVGASLRGANLVGASLRGAKLPYYKICPTTGSFIGWKSGKTTHEYYTKQTIIKIKILACSRRCSCLISRKCGCDLAYIESIEDTDGNALKKCMNWNVGYPREYEVGKFVSSKNYDPDLREDCASKIHFFITREEAEAWGR
jgi:hypothetical protein